MRKALVCIPLACLLPLATTSAIHAQNLEEVIVTADYRNASEASTASSISIIGADLIRRQSAQHFDDLIQSIPNLNYASGTSRARFFQIRGIGERSQFGSPLNPSVGFIVDNVDFSGIGSIGTLLDVDQVEVLRGPQGTRYGANALAGLINIKTNDPTDQQSVNIKLSAGEYNTQTASLVLNQPITDSVSARLVAQQHNSDGYYDNDFLNSDDVNERDELTLRAKLKAQLSDTWQVSMVLGKVDIDNGYDTFTLDNSRTTLSDQPGRDAQDSTSFSIQSDWQTPLADIQVIMAAANSDIEYSYDEDWTFTGIDPIGYTSFDSYQRERDMRSFEARIISTDDARIFNNSTAWLAGVYYLSSDEELLRQYTFAAGDFTSDYDFTTTALFAQLASDVAENWVLSFGARVEQRKTDYKNSDALDFDPSETLWGGRLALKHRWNDDTLVYASLARGYKAGGFNTDGSLDADLREFDSEYLWELELGLKADLSDSLQIRAAIFYDQREDQQVKSSVLRTRDNGSTEFIDFLGNAAEGTNLGLELETRWLINQQFSVNASVGLLDAKFDDFINEAGEDLSGRDQSQAPRYSYQVGLNWQNNNWSAGLSVNGKDQFYFSDRHDLKSTQYNLVNANVAFEKNNLTASLWARNLADKDYTVRGFGSFPNDPRNGYSVNGPYVQFGEPRIVGVTLEYAIGE